MAKRTVILLVALSVAMALVATSAHTVQQGRGGQRVEPAPLSPGDASLARFISEHAVEIEVRNTDGRVVRKGAGVISSDSGYVMTSLDVVVGGTEYVVSGMTVRGGRVARALAVSKAGQIAILQLTGTSPAVSTPARSESPPQAGDSIYTAPPPGPAEAVPQKGKVVAVKTEPDGAVVLELDFRTTRGLALYNSRGALVAIVRGNHQGRPSNHAVFVPDRMPGEWVLYFPARVGDPIARKPVSRVPGR